MTDAATGHGAARPKGPRLTGWFHRLIAKPSFQSWASRFPLTRGLARREGAEMFDLVAGFVQSQVLMAVVELRLLHRLMDAPRTPTGLAREAGMTSDRMEILLQAAAALGLARRRKDGRFTLARKGAALLGVPGLEAMILHHRAFYRDMEDPVALLRGEVDTELANFWPYVFGARGDVDPAVTRTYSDLMADSQGLVAQDTLRMVDLSDVKCLLDLGGGSGAFALAVAQAYPGLGLMLFDLPDVVPAARARFKAAGLGARLEVHGGSFRSDSLPYGADAISLIRVLYDHSDDTVRSLLSKIYDSLPPGGRLIISEPMSGGATPERAGDVYFAFYTMAMRTGKTRSAEEIGRLCSYAGFGKVSAPPARRPFVTSVVTCVKPD
jgi:demethylspheroidene O-methyltransferase